MTTQEKCWMLSLGQIPVPEYWYHQKKVREDIYTTVPSYTDITLQLRKMKKAIYVLIKNTDIKTRSEIYEILKERDFLPVLTHPAHPDRYLSRNRFYYYYTEVAKKYGIEKRIEPKWKYIKDNYKNLSVAELAIATDSQENYVRQMISRVKRGYY